MVDGNDRQPGSVALHLNRHRRLIKRRVDIVYGDGVVRVRRIAANVANNAELAAGLCELLLVDEGRDGLGQIDAVDENVALDDLGVGAGALRRLGQIPLLDLAAADLLEQVNGAGAAAAEGSENEGGGLAAGDLGTCGDVFLELGDELVLVEVVAATGGEFFDAREGLAFGVGELPCPSLEIASVGFGLEGWCGAYLDGQSSADEASVVSKGSNAPARRVLQELQIIQDTTAARETSQHLLPAALLLVAVGKVDHGVLKRGILLGQLLKANDDVVLRRLLPRVCRHKLAADLLVLLILEDALVIGVLWAALDNNGVASIQQGLGRRGRQARAVLVELGFGAGVQRGERHGDVWEVCGLGIWGAIERTAGLAI